MSIKIKMNETKVGTEDGFTNIIFQAGEVYDIGESLYKSFRSMGVCEKVLESEILETKIEPPIEEKAVIAPKFSIKKKKNK